MITAVLKENAIYVQEQAILRKDVRLAMAMEEFEFKLKEVIVNSISPSLLYIITADIWGLVSTNIL